MFSIISILILLVVVGFALWLLNFLPIVEPYKQIIYGVVIFLVIIYILQAVLGGPAILTVQ